MRDLAPELRKETGRRQNLIALEHVFFSANFLLLTKRPNKQWPSSFSFIH